MLSSGDAEPKELINCPCCRVGHLNKSGQKAKFGSSIVEKLSCDKCPTVLLKVQDKFKLVEGDKSSFFWRDYKEISLSVQQWNAFTQGGSLHYDPIIGTYVPYIPDKYSEPQPSWHSIPPSPISSSSHLQEQTLSATIHEVSVSSTDIFVDTAVNININISNDNNDPGIFTIPLFINDEFQENKTVTLFAKSSTIVTFNVIESIPGTYTVSVAGDLTHIVRFVVQPQICNKEINYEITITLDEALMGMEKDLNRNGKKLRIKFPTPIESGSKIRLHNALLTTDGFPGDIFITVQVK